MPGLLHVALLSSLTLLDLAVLCGCPSAGCLWTFLLCALCVFELQVYLTLFPCAEDPDSDCHREPFEGHREQAFCR